MERQAKTKYWRSLIKEIWMITQQEMTLKKITDKGSEEEAVAVKKWDVNSSDQLYLLAYNNFE